jgi:8-oxo-dGTP pyrophosphatase MutT (NUDIX family)
MTESPARAMISQRGVVFAPNRDVLILERTSDRTWELPGGRLDHDESASVGLRRELYEETSLSPSVVGPIHTYSWVNDAGQDRFAVCYVCRTTDRDIVLSPEHLGYEWVHPQAACDRVPDSQAQAIRNALQKDRETVATDD